jgi:hypothetical protein
MPLYETMLSDLVLEGYCVQSAPTPCTCILGAQHWDWKVGLQRMSPGAVGVFAPFLIPQQYLVQGRRQWMQLLERLSPHWLENALLRGPTL